ncbi:MAG: AAA family ATPase [Candidatus Nanoarchaeia archaeon]|nr:AAA family ATPase [Candidatus Nanoarchaeia archaeon]
MTNFSTKYFLEQRLPELTGFPVITKYIEGLSTEADDYPVRINKNLLKELLQIEHEKFHAIRGESNINADTGEVMALLSNYLKCTCYGGLECLTVGLPGSGKTTFVKKYFPEELIFNYDKECAEAYEREKDWVNGGLYYKRSVELSLRCILREKSVVIDSPAVTPKDRELRGEHKGRFCIIFDTGVETCYNRMRKRHKEGGTQVFELSDLVNFLLMLEFPVSKELKPLEFSTAFIIDSNGKLSKIYPLNYFNERFNVNYSL